MTIPGHIRKLRKEAVLKVAVGMSRVTIKLRKLSMYSKQIRLYRKSIMYFSNISILKLCMDLALLNLQIIHVYYN